MKLKFFVASANGTEGGGLTLAHIASSRSRCPENGKFKIKSQRHILQGRCFKMFWNNLLGSWHVARLISNDVI